MAFQPGNEITFVLEFFALGDSVVALAGAAYLTVLYIGIYKYSVDIR